MKFKMQTIVILMIFLTGLQWSYAQDRSISGTVNGADGEPLIGATIIVVDNVSIGTITDIDGSYSLSVPSTAQALVVSYLGYLTQEVSIGTNDVVNIVMSENSAQLEEVVVIGYGSRKKKDITSAISTISTKEIAKSVSLSPEFALQGRATGIQVQSASGDPGDRPTIRIRGVGTIGFNDPLIVVDGVPITEFGAGAVYSTSGAAANDLRGTQNILNTINPNDILSMSVLKDAAATAIYGLRASNGVILIETKRGKGATKPTVSFNVKRGVRNIRNTYDVLNTSDYKNLLNESYNNAGEPLPTWLDPADPGYLGHESATYDWQQEMLNENAVTEDYSVSIASGGKKSNFYFSAGYANQESVLKFNEFKRYSVSMNSDFKVTDWLEIGETFRLAYTQGDDSRGKGGSPATLVSLARTPSWQPIYDNTNEVGFAPSRDETGNLLWGQGTGINQFGIPNAEFLKYNVLRNLGSAYVKIKPIDGLTIKGSLSLDWYYSNRNDLISTRATAFRITGGRTTSTYTERHSRNWNLLSEFQVNYNRTVGDKHNFDILLNTSFQKYGFDGVGASAEGIRFEGEEIVTISPRALGTTSSASSVKERRKLAGTLIRLGYNYDSRYIVDLTWRRDGSSVFGPGFRYGNFYGVSAAWRLSSEEFLKDVTFLNDLKIRGGWGQAGNQETAPFGYTPSINLNPKYPLGNTDNVLAIGSYPANFPIPDLSWEVNTSKNIGFDASMLDYRLNVSFDYYDRLTDGILRPLGLPSTVGVNSNPVVNLAQVSNKGMELALNWTDNVGDFSYNVGANITTITNRVEKLFVGDQDNDRILGGEYAIQVGESINYIYGYQTVGLFQSDTEVQQWKDSHSDPGRDDMLAPGDVQFADLFGAPAEGEFKSATPDGVINDFDRTKLGKTVPGYFYGINLGAGYKGLDVSVFFQGVGDIQKINNARRSGEFLGSQGNNSWTTVLNRWTPSNTETEIPRALVNDQVGNARFSSRWVEDANYLRLQNMQIGYTFPQKTLEALKMQNLRVYLSGSNLAIFTNYSGLDPEVNLSQDTDFVPPAVVWLLGATVNF